MRKKYLDLAKSMRSLADSIEALTEETKDQHDAGLEEIREREEAQEVRSKISFEDLRAVLAELTRNGKQQEVKELITSYGAKKLSDVQEDKYEGLLDKARKI